MSPSSSVKRPTRTEASFLFENLVVFLLITKYRQTMVSEDKLRKVNNALVIGMAAEDAYIYAGLDPQEIIEIEEDKVTQRHYRQLHKEVEYSLLDNMRLTSLEQVKRGRSDATIWLLEHLFPRYAAKTASDLGTISLKLADNVAEPEIIG